MILYLKNAHLSLIGDIDNFAGLLRFIMFIYKNRFSRVIEESDNDINPNIYGDINLRSLFGRRRIQPAVIEQPAIIEQPRINELIRESIESSISLNYLERLYLQNKLEIDRIKDIISTLSINREISYFITEITRRNNETMSKYRRMNYLNITQIATFIFLY